MLSSEILALLNCSRGVTTTVATASGIAFYLGQDRRGSPWRRECISDPRALKVRDNRRFKDALEERVDESVSDATSSPAEHTLSDAFQRPQQFSALNVPEADAALKHVVVLAHAPFLCKVPDTRTKPGIAPAKQIEREIGPCKRGWPLKQDNRLGFEVHRSAGSCNLERKVTVTLIRGKTFVKSAQSIQDVFARKQAMRLRIAACAPFEALTHLGERFAGKRRRLMQSPHALLLNDRKLRCS